MNMHRHSFVAPTPERNRLFDKMDVDNDGEQTQQHNPYADAGLNDEMARAFEFDIHDCSVSEAHR